LVKLECLEIILFNKACDLNFGVSCSQLGFMYEEGKGVKQDDFKAVNLPSSYISPRLEQPLSSFKSHAFWKNLSALKSSCLTSLPVTYLNLGFVYEEGKGVKQDDSKALKFYQKACDLNDGSGCSQLGFMYEKGKGQITRLLVKFDCFKIILFNAFASVIHKSKIVKQDNFKALKFYQKACDLNSGSGCSILGYLYGRDHTPFGKT
jgi:TPR repeat protein